MKKLFVIIAAVFAAEAALPVAARDRVPATPPYQGTFAPGASYEVCFTPGMDCTAMIVQVLDGAKATIRFQAYSFTSAPIAEALKAAQRRGVDVQAVFDKSQQTERYSAATFLVNAGIPVVIDAEPKIAHNKVIVVDERSADPAVVTGSFNFTKAAQFDNAENVFVIRGNPAIAGVYAQNFYARQRVSTPYLR